MPKAPGITIQLPWVQRRSQSIPVWQNHFSVGLAPRPNSKLHVSREMSISTAQTEHHYQSANGSAAV